MFLHELIKQRKREGLEAIKFQGSIADVQPLIKIFQDAIDYRDGLDYSKKSTNVPLTEFRRQAMFKYCNSTLGPAFCKYVEKRFNFVVTKVVFVEQPFITGMYAVLLNMGDDWEDISNQMTRYSGSSVVESDPSKNMIEMSKAFDVNTGKLKNFKFENKLPIAVTMYFDQNCSFLLKDFMPNHLVEELTAEEMASIMLHECGHVVTVVENAAKLFHTYEFSTAHLEYLIKNKNLEQAATYTKETINAAVASGGISKEAAVKVTAVIDNLYYLMDHDESIPATVAIVVVHLFVLAVKAIFCITVSTLFFTVMLNALFESIFDTSVSGGKSSDTMAGPKNYYHVERLADEFVSRLGMGSHIGSGLAKLQTIFSIKEHHPCADLPSQRLNKSQFANVVLHVYMQIVKGFGFSDRNTIYEKDNGRIQRLIDNNMQVFKNDLPKNALAHYVKDTERLMKTLKEIESRDTFPKAMQWLLTNIGVLTPVKLLLKIQTGNITVEVDECIRQLEAIVGTKMNYYGAKFQQLAYRKAGNEASMDKINKAWDLLYDNQLDFKHLKSRNITTAQEGMTDFFMES